METSATIKMKQEKDGIIISSDSGQEWKFDRMRNPPHTRSLSGGYSKPQ